MNLAPTANSPLLGRPVGDLLLRVCGTRHDGRVVRLSSAKCTVGSGDRCTLRLRAPGIDPLHCLILRGADRTVIRRWSPNTRLNGQAFRDAPLLPGDHFNVGSLEFEVLSNAHRGPRPDTTTETATDAAPEWASRVSELERQNDDLTNALNDFRSQWSSQQHQSDEGRHSAEASLADRARQLDERDAALEKLRLQLEESNLTTAQNQSSEIKELRQQLDVELRRSTTDREQWHAERRTVEAELAARTAQLETTAKELAAQRTELDNARSKIAVEQAAATQSARDQVETERQRWQTTRQQVEEQLSARSKTLDAEAAALERRVAKLERDEAALATRQAELESTAQQLDQKAPADETPEIEPTVKPAAQRAAPAAARSGEHVSPEAADLFARLRELSVLKDDQDKEDDASALVVEPEVIDEDDIVDVDPDSAVATDEGEEESIEAYMARLLHRTQNRSSEKHAPARQEPRPEPTPRKSKVKNETPVEHVEPAKPQPLTQEEFQPRSSAPELSSNLSAMRELANFSARAAIGRHLKTRSARDARDKSILTVTSTVIGIIMFCWGGGGFMALLGGLTALGFAAFWGGQVVVLTKKANVVAKPETKTTPVAEDVQPADDDQAETEQD